MSGNADQGIHRIVHVGEAAALAAVAEDRDVGAGQRLGHEIGDDHAVTAGLPRSHGVEQAGNHGGNLALFPVSDGQELVDGLGAGIAPAALVRRSPHHVVVFAEGNLLRLAVHLGGRGDQHALALGLSQLQHDLGAANVGLDGAHRAVHDQAHAHGRRQVIDDVAQVDQFRHQMRVGDAVDVIGELGMDLEVLNVGDGAGGEIVDDVDLVAQIEVPLGKVRADKAGSPGNEDLQ